MAKLVKEPLASSTARRRVMGWEDHEVGLDAAAAGDPPPLVCAKLRLRTGARRGGGGANRAASSGFWMERPLGV